MSIHVSGGGGGLPGVTTDGLTPGGLKVAGALTAGKSDATSVPSIHAFFGSVRFTANDATNADNDHPFFTYQQGPNSQDNYQPGFLVQRSDPGPFPFLEPLFLLYQRDAASMVLGSISPAASGPPDANFGQPYGFRINAVGMLGENGTTPPSGPPSITGNVTTGTLANLQSVMGQLLTALDACGKIAKNTT